MNIREEITRLTDGFIDLWKSSAIVQGLIALIATGTSAYLYITGKVVPVELVSIVALIVGYYFGSKSQQAQNKMEDKYATRFKHRPNKRTNRPVGGGKEDPS